jgi:hypothetical protein
MALMIGLTVAATVATLVASAIFLAMFLGTHLSPMAVMNVINEEMESAILTS